MPHRFRYNKSNFAQLVCKNTISAQEITLNVNLIST